MWRAATVVLLTPALSIAATPSSQGPATVPAAATQIAPQVSTQSLSVGDAATTWVFARAGASRLGVESVADVAPFLTPEGPIATLITPGPIIAQGGILARWPSGQVASAGRTLRIGLARARGWWQAPGVDRTPLAPSALRFPGEDSAPAPGTRVAALGASFAPNRAVRRTIGALGPAAHNPAALRLLLTAPNTRERRALGPGKPIQLGVDVTGLAPGLRWALGGGAPLGAAPVSAALAANARGDTVWVVADSGTMPAAPLARALATRGFRTIYAFADGVGATVAGRSVREGVGVAVALRSDGVRIEQAPTRLTPSGDGVADRGAIRVVAPKSGALTIGLERAGARTDLLATTLSAPTRTGAGLDPTARGLAPGRYQLTATLTPADGSPASTDTRTLVIDPTLARFTLARTRQGTRPATAIMTTLARPAALRTFVRTPAGRTIEIGTSQRLGSGAHRREWDGRIGNRDAPPGDYIVRVQATGPLGTSVLERRLTLSAERAQDRAQHRAQDTQAQSALPER